MRRIGTLSDRQEAERFGDYLLTQQIKSQIDSAGNEWAVWVYDEDRLDEARSELEAYRADPQSEKYREAVVAADRLRHEEVRKQTQAKKNTVNMADRWRRPLIQQIPVTFALIVLSVIATVGTRFMDDLGAFGGSLTIVSGMDSDGKYTRFPRDYKTLPGIRDGQVWRLFTPAFLHGSPLHLIGNMYMTVLMGGVIERMRGSRTMLILFLFTGLVAHLAQLYARGPAFGGMSGVDFGLFGFMWISGTMSRKSDLALPPRFVFIMIAWLVICATGALGIPIANYAHFGGLFAGMAAAAVNVTWRRGRQG